jgi:hypothetical protein
MFLLAAAFTIVTSTATTVIAEEEKETNRIIQYRGPMPLLGKTMWGRDVELKFELYRSPTGGTPFWTESRRVAVTADGMVSVDLGRVEPLPDEAFTTPFRFLSIWHERTEFVPRKQVVSVVYVSAPYEAGVTADNYLEWSLAGARAAADKAPDREKRLDALVNCGSFSMETHPRHPLTWLDAMETARRLGARLPTFDEWYAAYDGKEAKSLVGMVGHYEWVVPWVYEPTIHGRMQELYRGKPVACYYNEISPLNIYPFRLAERLPSTK